MTTLSDIYVKMIKESPNGLADLEPFGFSISRDGSTAYKYYKFEDRQLCMQVYPDGSRFKAILTFDSENTLDKNHPLLEAVSEDSSSAYFALKEQMRLFSSVIETIYNEDLIKKTQSAAQ
jgi:hypothetical protein